MTPKIRRNALTRSLALVGLLGFILGGGACSESSKGDAAGSGGPDAGFGLLLITVDGLIPGTLEPFGGSTPVPHLEALIAEGRAWGDAWTSSPMSRPGVTTYLTGRTPDRHGVWDDHGDHLEPDVPTLARVLGANGFRTAAFPDAAHLGFGSGLLDGFQVVDEPPDMPLGIDHWRTVVGEPGDQVRNFTTWLSSLEPGARWFAWLHVANPALAQVAAMKSAEVADGATAFDDWLGEIRSTVGQNREHDAIGIAVAGTFADIRGANSELAGVGMSVGDAAVGVPLVLRFPNAAARVPAQTGPVWAPDVPVTLAALAGVSIEGAEGRDLAQPLAPTRIVYSWSRAPRDQLGWKPLSAARRGDERARSDSAAEPAGESGSLAESLASRPVILRQPASEEVREALATRGLQPSPIPPEGRNFGPADRRREVSRVLFVARDHLQNEDLSGARDALRRLATIDPESLAALLDIGQLQMLGGDTKSASRSLSRAAELYPDDPESVHWYVHATWDPTDRGTERLLRLILPGRRNDPDLLYDLACLRSLDDDIPASEKLLRSSIEAGFRQWGHMEVDPDLRALRESGRFAAVMRDLRQ